MFERDKITRVDCLITINNNAYILAKVNFYKSFKTALCDDAIKSDVENGYNLLDRLVTTMIQYLMINPIFYQKYPGVKILDIPSQTNDLCQLRLIYN